MKARTVKVFISYKWEGPVYNKWIETLASDLRRAGVDALLDRWEVSLGESFTEYMASKISAADVILFVMTTASVQAVESQKRGGGAVRFEMQMALARLIAGEKMRLIGVYREGVGPPKSLRDRRYIDFRDDVQYSERLRELVDDLLGVKNKPPLGEEGMKSSVSERESLPTADRSLPVNHGGVEALRREYNRLLEEYYWSIYAHMDSDHGEDLSGNVSYLRKKLERLQAKIRDAGGEAPDF